MSEVKTCPICLSSRTIMSILNEINIHTGEVKFVNVKYRCNECGMTIERCGNPHDLSELQGQKQVEESIRILSGLVREIWNNPKCMEIRKKVILANASDINC